MKHGFTLIELLLATLLLGMMSVVSIVTYRAVTSGWRVSRDYMDKLQRTDYMLDQLVSGLKCAVYPHLGEQSVDYGFLLENNGDGSSPRDSDVIEWTKKGPALIGADAAGDAEHRIQIRVLEAGSTEWGGEPIEKTGLYARVKPIEKVLSTNAKSADEFTFANSDLYRPVLIAKDVDGFDCRVQSKEPDDAEGKEDKDSFEDEFTSSNAVPYKVRMTMYVLKEDPEYSSQRQRVPILKVVRLPIHEQSLDGAVLPTSGQQRNSGKGPGGPK